MSRRSSSERGAGASHRRRNMALMVVGASVLSAGIGIVVGRSIRSPADAAADAAAPTPSRITVPVERRELIARLVANGEVQFNEPTPLRLAGSVGPSGGATQVVTQLPELNRELNEGDIALEVSGRPVFVFEGALPTYRPFEPGTRGPDVLQLEQALQRLGFLTVEPDDLYDDATESAVDALYFSQGYASEGPTTEQRDALRNAEKGVNDATTSLNRARQDLANAGKPISGADLLRAQQDLQRARDAVPAAEAAAVRRNTEAAAAVTTATATRDALRVQRDAAKTILDAALVPGAINAETGVEFTAAEIAALRDALAQRERELIDADATVRRVTGERDTTATDAQKAIDEAKAALTLAQLTYNEAIAPKDTGLAREAVKTAEAALLTAQGELLRVQSQVGTKMPAGEMIFLPSLPTTITQVSAEAGKAPADPVATVSGTTTLIQARISAADADLVQVPTPVDIELRDVDIVTTGRLIEIKKQSNDNGDNGGGGGDGGGDQEDGRLVVVIEPDQPELLSQWVGFPARISITVSSTDGDVLAVPVAALSVGPDGDSRVEVERSEGDGPDATEFVKVTVGLSAEGYAEIIPVGGATLNEGDRLVVGEDTGRRRRSSSNDESDDGASG
jgi:peptidoglycan hydrolase-like protein with peptidoglycan-binding domain